MQYIIAVLFAAGLFLILCDLMRVPYMKTSKAASNLLKQQKKNTGTVEIWLNDLAVWLSKRLRLNEYKKIQMTADLQSAGINVTPELMCFTMTFFVVIAVEIVRSLGIILGGV